MTSPTEPADPFDPAANLQLIKAQQQRAGAALEPRVDLIYGAWGLALLIGEGALFLAWWAGSPIKLATWAAGLILLVLLVSAATVTGVHIARSVTGVRGDSARQGQYYGWGWMLGFVGLGAVIGGVADAGVGPETIGSLWASGSALIIGIMYIAGGALWLDRSQVWLGAWFVITGGVGGLLGSPWVYLVLSLAGGGGMLLVAMTYVIRRGRRT